MDSPPLDKADSKSLSHKNPVCDISKSMAINVAQDIEMNLHPPRLSVGTEVCLGPGIEKNGSRIINFNVGKGKWKGGGSADDGSSGSVLKKREN